MKRYQEDQKLIQELHEIYAIKPNDLGKRWLTTVYKLLTRPLKKMPFIYLIPCAAFIALFVYILLGHVVTKLVTLLQYGF